MSYPPHLLDELARVFAEAALDQLVKERAARGPRPDDPIINVGGEIAPSKRNELKEGDDSG
jgi:hypothetical protein